jgi:hypothetical protein
MRRRFLTLPWPRLTGEAGGGPAPAQASQHVAPSGGSPTRRGVKCENWRRNIMHPLFVTLFIETDADDALTEQQERKRRAHAVRRGRSARVVKVAAANRDRQRRP